MEKNLRHIEPNARGTQHAFRKRNWNSKVAFFTFFFYHGAYTVYIYIYIGSVDPDNGFAMYTIYM